MSKTLSEHIEYLTLPGRNDLYRAAIAQAMEPGATVADLGCGVGVLGIFCLEAGASEVWGIDNSEAIYLAEETLKRAGLDKRYHCIADSTFRTKLPTKVDLIICDHVGFFGFDYGIIAMMRDARERFLKPGGTMIPQAIDLFVAGVESDQCTQLASAWRAQSVPPQYHWIDGNARNVRYQHVFSGDELISTPCALGTVSLTQDEPEMFAYKTTITASRAGRFDGLAGWFDCHLAGDVRMTNSPLKPESIKRAQAFLPAERSFDVAQGDEIDVTLRFRADDPMMAWSIRPPGGAKPQKLSTFKSAVLTPADLVKDSGQPVALTQIGEAQAYVMALVDGNSTSEEIVLRVLSDRPDLMPSEKATRDFVLSVLANHCEV